MKKFRQEKLDEISTIPEADGSAWLRDAERSIEFLEDNKDRDEVVIYASTKCVLVHGVLGLSDKLTPDAVSDLQHQNIPMTDDSWRIQYAWGGGMGHRIYLEPPMSSVSEALVGGEKLVFRRPFTGVDDGPAQIEISQKLVHSLDLHYLDERSGFCRLDDQGDIEEVIKIRQRDTDSTWDYLHVVTVLRSELDRFMAVSGTCLVFRFDFTRVRWGNFCGWGDIERYERTYDDLYYHGGVSNNGSYCNGVMVVRPAVSVEDLVEEWKAEEDGSSKQYATFKIYDRKNRKNVETSCSPAHISNYFQKSELPWEISPAFFKPTVLLKYKADPDKYTLEDRTISCRNAWYLPTYDINEAGQVHTYIGYLADLPYQEQQYWQSFNEWPKGGISKRAFQTDIVGDWYTEYDPLSALKTAVSQLDAEPPNWWNKRGENLMMAVRYPATDSNKEWADELLALDQLVVEGFQTKPLRKLVVGSESKVDPKWGSIRVLQEVIQSRGASEEEAREIVRPFRELHSLRTTVRGHATGDSKKQAEKDARRNYGTLRAHFENLAKDCDQSFTVVRSTLDPTHSEQLS